MQKVLTDKSTMVVNSLISMLSPRNSNDVHQAINASAVLTDFTENSSFFAILTKHEVLQNIVNVVTSMDAN